MNWVHWILVAALWIGAEGLRLLSERMEGELQAFLELRHQVLVDPEAAIQEYCTAADQRARAPVLLGPPILPALPIFCERQLLWHPGGGEAESVCNGAGEAAAWIRRRYEMTLACRVYDRSLPKIEVTLIR